jgi:gamma-glutamyltranspeptidase/glutathione hydrolase
MQKGDTRIAFGIMGGWNQSQAHAQFVSNVADFGMNIQAALEAPRFTKLTFDGCDLFMESRVPPEVLKELQSMGHKIQLAGPYSGRMGGGQAVMSIADGVRFGASGPRKALVRAEPLVRHTEPALTARQLAAAAVGYCWKDEQCARAR